MTISPVGEVFQFPKLAVVVTNPHRERRKAKKTGKSAEKSLKSS
jgi:hypothetical protein